MSLRQSAFGLLRRLRYPHRAVTAVAWSRPTNNALIQTGKKEFSSDYGFGRQTWKSQSRDFALWIWLSGQAVILCVNSSPALAEDVSIEPSSEKDLQEANLTGLRKIEDGSVISNIHTSKWRVFTDHGKDLFLQGKLEEAERLFLSALQEAKEGFGERDPHVASAFNNLPMLNSMNFVEAWAAWILSSSFCVIDENIQLYHLLILVKTLTPQASTMLLDTTCGFGTGVVEIVMKEAELYRVKKVFDKAEPLYLEAVKILEESFGPEDIRAAGIVFTSCRRSLHFAIFSLVVASFSVGTWKYPVNEVASPNLYLIIAQLAMKVPNSLKHLRNEFCDDFLIAKAFFTWVGASLHNLGQFYLVQRKLEKAHMCYEVLHLQGKEKDSESLIQESIRIMEEGGHGESGICLRRLRYLAQMYIKSNKPAEAENVQRKVLHIMELSKGWNSLDTVIAAEGLGLTLQSVGNLRESKDLLERCLEARKTILPQDHIQVASNMLYIARVEMLNSDRLRMMNMSEAIAEVDKVKVRLVHSIRIAQKILNKSAKQEDRQRYSEVSRQTGKDEQAARVILLQSLNALGLLEITKKEILESKGEHSPAKETEDSLRHFISAFNMFRTERLKKSFSSELRSEYLSCLKNFSSLISNSTSDSMQRGLLETLEDEIKHVEVFICIFPSTQNHLMDRDTNPRGLGSSERPVGHTHFLLSPYNSADREHNSDLLDTYERERISRELEYYIEEAAKSTTANVKSNGEIGNDPPSGNRSRFRRVMSLPRLPPERDPSGSGGGGMKKKFSEKKSKEIILEASMPPGRDTGGGGGGGMKKKIETKSKETIEVLQPERDTRSGGGGGMKKSETKSKETTEVSWPERDTRSGGGGGMKKKSETKSKETIEVSRPERDTRSGGGDGGGMKKKSEAKNCKAITEGNFLLKHASTVCNSSESDVVQFGRDFLRAQVAAGRLPGKGT
ncbi:hypothetical protein RHMOL_Rhmol08G0023100 [Rhododendron molle]|uniref:Uncharacterized protein n=1 Tax=Rhododendron molle TaxID=49168 RepID=A0ACC0MJJ0_RHOML|nr:hypothetical protein RHMOL_Rhmol08G0023100 [Rhododendron molle]